MNTDKKKVTTTKERVIKASESCPDAKGVLKELFPEVFKEEWHDITGEIQFGWDNCGTDWYFLRLYHGNSRTKSAEIGIVFPESGVFNNGLKIQSPIFKLECDNDTFRILKKW